MRRLFVILTILLMGSLPTVSLAETPDEVTIGINTYPVPIRHGEILEATVNRLKAALAPRKLKVFYADLPELTSAILEKKADLVIVTSGQYRQLSRMGLRDIAAISVPGYADMNHADGGTIVVRADRSDIRHIADLKGKTLSANTPNGFNGFLVQMGEVAHRGFDPDAFFSRIRYTGEGGRMTDVVTDVVNGRSDAGFLAMCLLETLQSLGYREADQLKVVSDYSDEALPCRRSTELYPSWVFATTSTASPQLARDAAAAVLSVPLTPHGYQWGVATDFSRVDALFRELKRGPYAYLREWSFGRLWRDYGNLVVAAVLLIAGLIVHYVRVNVLVRRRTRELSEALKTQERLQRTAQEANDRMERLQRAAAVSQMSSMLAHELGQPLNAVYCYTRGLMQRMEDEPETVDRSMAGDVLEKVLEQTERARSIVNDVRACAKQQADRNQRIDLAAIARTAVHNLSLTGKYKAVRPEVRLSESLPMTGNALEMELLVLNLLKNAAEAVMREPKAVITLTGTRSEDKASVVLQISDNGPVVTDAAFRRLEEPLASGKVNGLGLGLTIVRSIAEAHRGRIHFKRNVPHGVTAEAVFPCAEE